MLALKELLNQKAQSKNADMIEDAIKLQTIK